MDSDFIKGINKSIDAVTGETGGDYTYKHHTDTTEALDRLADVIASGVGGASSMADLEDVDISGTPQGGSVLKYDATEGKWTPGDDAGNIQSDWNESSSSSGAYILNKPTIPSGIGDLGAININSSTLDDGQVLVYDETNQEWKNDDPPASVSALGDLTDVTISSVDDNQALVYDETNEEWKNKTITRTLTQAEYDALTEEERTNGTIYLVTDDGFVRTLTQAQYDALSTEEKMNGTLYFITDTGFVRILTQAEYDALSNADKNNGTMYCISDASPTAPSISELRDILISSQTLANGQVLTYDSTSSKWINAAVPTVQSDWDETDNTAASYIQNKPTIPAAQVQANWTEADSTAASYIQNKPTIPAEQVRSDWDESDTTSKAYILNKPSIPTGIDELGTVDIDTTSLSNGQVLTYDSTNDKWVNGNNSSGQVQADWDETDNTAASYIQNKPTIPAAQVQSNWNESDTTAVSYIQNKPNPASIVADASRPDYGEGIANNTAANIGNAVYNVTLPGLYLVIAGIFWESTASFPISDTGTKSIRIDLVDVVQLTSSTVIDHSAYETVAAADRTLRQQVMWVKEITASDISGASGNLWFEIGVRQNSGSTQNASQPYLQVVKLA